MHHLTPPDLLSKELASFKKSMSVLSRRMAAFDDVLKVDNRYRDLCPAKNLNNKRQVRQLLRMSVAGIFEELDEP